MPVSSGAHTRRLDGGRAARWPEYSADIAVAPRSSVTVAVMVAPMAVVVAAIGRLGVEMMAVAVTVVAVAVTVTAVAVGVTVVAVAVAVTVTVTAAAAAAAGAERCLRRL